LATPLSKLSARIVPSDQPAISEHPVLLNGPGALQDLSSPGDSSRQLFVQSSALPQSSAAVASNPLRRHLLLLPRQVQLHLLQRFSLVWLLLRLPLLRLLHLSH